MKAQRDPPGPFPQSSPSARAPTAPVPATGTLVLQDRPDTPLRRGSQSVCRDRPRCRKEPARTRFSQGTSGNPQMQREAGPARSQTLLAICPCGSKPTHQGGHFLSALQRITYLDSASQTVSHGALGGFHER